MPLKIKSSHRPAVNALDDCQSRHRAKLNAFEDWRKGSARNSWAFFVFGVCPLFEGKVKEAYSKLLHHCLVKV